MSYLDLVTHQDNCDHKLIECECGEVRVAVLVVVVITMVLGGMSLANFRNCNGNGHDPKEFMLGK